MRRMLGPLLGGWLVLSLLWAGFVIVAAYAGRSSSPVDLSQVAVFSVLPPAAILSIGWLVVEAARNWHRRLVRSTIMAAGMAFVAARVLAWWSESLPGVVAETIHTTLTTSPGVFVANIAPGAVIVAVLLACRFGRRGSFPH